MPTARRGLIVARARGGVLITSKIEEGLGVVLQANSGCHKSAGVGVGPPQVRRVRREF